MTLYSDLIPVSWTLLKRRCFWQPGGSYSITAPALTTHLRVTAMASGGQGEVAGGSSAFVKALVACAPGDSITGYVGQVATAGTAGDTWVRKNGGLVAYADRGRGANGDPGQAALSTGDLRLDGRHGYAAGAPLNGMPVTDPSSFSLFPPGRRSADGGGVSPGAGGFNLAVYAQDDTSFIWWYAYSPGGPGRAMVEFYKGDPAH